MKEKKSNSEGSIKIHCKIQYLITLVNYAKIISKDPEAYQLVRFKK